MRSILIQIKWESAPTLVNFVFDGINVGRMTGILYGNIVLCDVSAKGWEPVVHIGGS